MSSKRKNTPIKHAKDNSSEGNIINSESVCYDFSDQEPTMNSYSWLNGPYSEWYHQYSDRYAIDHDNDAPLNDSRVKELSANCKGIKDPLSPVAKQLTNREFSTNADRTEALGFHDGILTTENCCYFPNDTNTKLLGTHHQAAYKADGKYSNDFVSAGNINVVKSEFLNFDRALTFNSTEKPSIRETNNNALFGRVLDTKTHNSLHSYKSSPIPSSLVALSPLLYTSMNHNSGTIRNYDGISDQNYSYKAADARILCTSMKQVLGEESSLIDKERQISEMIAQLQDIKKNLVRQKSTVS